MTAGVTVELPVHGRPVLLAGASARAISTAAALVDAGAVLTIVCPSPAPYFDDLAERGLLTLHRREPTAADISSAAIVFAHTGSRERDRGIARRAEQLNRLCVCPEPPAAPTTGPRAGGDYVPRRTAVGATVSQADRVQRVRHRIALRLLLLRAAHG